MNATGSTTTDTGRRADDRTGNAMMSTEARAAGGGRAAQSDAEGPARILSVNRMNVRQWMLFALPWAIIITVVAAHTAILAIIRGQGTQLPDESFNGVGSTLFFFAVAMYASITTHHFPFAMGLGVTRRDFFWGTGVTALASGLVNGILVVAFAQIERSTDGFGVHMEAFSVVFRVTENRLLVFAGIVLVTMAFAAVGMVAGVVYLKWQANGVFAAALVIALAAAVTALLITWQQGWPAVGRLFSDSPVAALVLGVPLVLGALLYGAGYRMMRTVEA